MRYVVCKYFSTQMSNVIALICLQTNQYRYCYDISAHK